jgi:hypothetical protein
MMKSVPMLIPDFLYTLHRPPDTRIWALEELQGPTEEEQRQAQRSAVAAQNGLKYWISSPSFFAETSPPFLFPMLRTTSRAFH